MLTIQSLVLLFQEAPETRAAAEAREVARWESFRQMLRQNSYDEISKMFKKPKDEDRHPFVVACVEQGVMIEKSAQNRLSEMRSIIKAYDYGMNLEAAAGWKSAVALADEIRKDEKKKQQDRAAKAERDEVRNAIVAQVLATNPDAKVADQEAAVDAALASLAGEKAYQSACEVFAEAIDAALPVVSNTDLCSIIVGTMGPDAARQLAESILYRLNKAETVVEAAPVTVEKLLARA